MNTGNQQKGQRVHESSPVGTSFYGGKDLWKR